MVTLLFRMTLLAVLLCGTSLSRNIMSGAPELGDEVLFDWRVIEESYIQMTVKLPVHFKWVAIGFQQIPLTFTEWEDLAYISIEKEDDSLVSILKTLHLDTNGVVKKVQSGLYDWQRNGRRKSRGFFYFSLTRELGTLPLDSPIRFVWSYGKYGSFEKLLKPLDYGIVTLNQPDILTVPILKSNVTQMQPSNGRRGNESKLRVTTLNNKGRDYTGKEDEFKSKTDPDSDPDFEDNRSGAPYTGGEYNPNTNSVSNEEGSPGTSEEEGETGGNSDNIEPGITDEAGISTTTEVNNAGDQGVTETNDASGDQNVTELNTKEGNVMKTIHNTERGNVAETEADIVNEQGTTMPNNNDESEANNKPNGSRKTNDVNRTTTDTQILKNIKKILHLQPSEPTVMLSPSASEGIVAPTATTRNIRGQRSTSSTPIKGCSCNKRRWYDMFVGKESTVYFAVIGVAALLTGFVVLCLACCCTRKKAHKIRRVKKNKVSFYKVDDFESSDADEEIEFLRDDHESDIKKNMKHV